MNASKTALFGGALMAAGISGTAGAQSFTTNDSGSYNLGPTAYSESTVFAYSYQYAGSAYFLNTISNQTSPGVNLSQSLDAYGTATNVQVGSNILRVDSTWDGTQGYLGSYGYGGSSLLQFFSVASEGTLRFTWDVTDTDSFEDAIELWDGGDLLVDIDPGDLGVGTLEIDIDAGVNYAVILDIEQVFTFTPGVTSFIQVELIPAPGPAAVAGLAGLAMVRRRR